MGRARGWCGDRRRHSAVKASRTCRRAIRADACTRYKALGIWGSDPRLPRTGYDRLLASLVSGSFVSPGTAYDVAVDNSLADAVVAEDPPPLP